MVEPSEPTAAQARATALTAAPLCGVKVKQIGTRVPCLPPNVACCDWPHWAASGDFCCMACNRPLSTVCTSVGPLFEVPPAISISSGDAWGSLISTSLFCCWTFQSDGACTEKYWVVRVGPSGCGLGGGAWVGSDGAAVSVAGAAFVGSGAAVSVAAASVGSGAVVSVAGGCAVACG